MSHKILKAYLNGALSELEKLTAQIQESRDFNRENEVYFLLRELIREQVGTETSEDSRHSNHAAR